MHSVDDLVVCLCDFSGHVGRHIDGFCGVLVGYGVGQRNFEGRILLQFSLENELCVFNTRFKSEKKK